MWPFKGKNQDADKPLTKEERADLIKKMKAASKELAKMKETLNLASAKDIIEFKVSTIHKDRIGLILNKIEKIDSTQSYNKLKDQWRASAKATDGWWLGEVKASGPREKLISVMHKIANEGGTITVDPIHEINVPPANKWWDAEWEDQMERKMAAEKEAKKKEKDTVKAEQKVEKSEAKAEQKVEKSEAKAEKEESKTEVKTEAAKS